MDYDMWQPCLAEDVHVPYGAIIGDICGSHYSKISQVFDDSELIELVNSDCTFTANTVLTMAVADAIGQPCGNRDMESRFHKAYREWIGRYPCKKYPADLQYIVNSEIRAVDREVFIDSSAWVSPIGWMCAGRSQRDPDFWFFGNSINQMQGHATFSSSCYNGVAGIVFMCAQGEHVSIYRKQCEHFFQRFGMPSETLQELRSGRAAGQLHISNRKLALRAFFESHDFTSAIQNAISLGGNSATIAAITGSIAEAAYREIPQKLIDFVKSKLPEEMIAVIEGTDPRFTEYCTDEEAAEIKKELEIKRLEYEEVRRQKQAEYDAIRAARAAKRAKKAANKAAAELAARQAKKAARRAAWEANQAAAEAR
jgi:hypothetical protein